MKAPNAQQQIALERLAVAAEERDQAEALWRARVKRVEKLLTAAEKHGIPTATLARTANVSRQYLWKRQNAKAAS